jgi:hypothetical protein
MVRAGELLSGLHLRCGEMFWLSPAALPLPGGASDLEGARPLAPAPAAAAFPVTGQGPRGAGAFFSFSSPGRSNGPAWSSEPAPAEELRERRGGLLFSDFGSPGRACSPCPCLLSLSRVWRGCSARMACACIQRPTNATRSRRCA